MNEAFGTAALECIGVPRHTCQSSLYKKHRAREDVSLPELQAHSSNSVFLKEAAFIYLK